MNWFTWWMILVYVVLYLEIGWLSAVHAEVSARWQLIAETLLWPVSCVLVIVVASLVIALIWAPSRVAREWRKLR